MLISRENVDVYAVVDSRPGLARCAYSRERKAMSHDYPEVPARAERRNRTKKALARKERFASFLADVQRYKRMSVAELEAIESYDELQDALLMRSFDEKED